MAPNGGALLLLLIVACAALALPPPGMSENERVKILAKKLMNKCLKEGHPVPDMKYLKTMFKISDLPEADRNLTDTFLSTCLNFLHSVSPDKTNQEPRVDRMTNQMWNSSKLITMIRLIRNSSASSACYMKACVAPLCWANLTAQHEKIISSDVYETLLQNAKPALGNMPLTERNLPANVGSYQNLRKAMDMLKELYDIMPKGQRTRVVKWFKEQIAQIFFNCTMRPTSDPRSKHMKPCKPSLKWLNFEALGIIRQYISDLALNDVDSSPKEQLCKFFLSAPFNFTSRIPIRMYLSLGKKFLQKYQECFRGKEEFAANVDKLGILACYYSTVPDLNPELSRKFLDQLDNCDDITNPKITQLKKHVLKVVIQYGKEALCKLGKTSALLTPKQLSEIPTSKLKESVKCLGPIIRWRWGQLQTLIQKLRGNVSKCHNVSVEEFNALQTVARGLPICALKHVKAILNDTEILNNMTKRMSKGQLMAMLQGLRGGKAFSGHMLNQLPRPLLNIISLNKLDKANITSLDQVMKQIWSVPQAAFLTQHMPVPKSLYWRLRSLLQGITCKMIDKVADSDVLGMAQNMTETPKWLSNVLVGCAARKLFAILENERTDYFKTITEKEMDQIPTLILCRLPPWKVKDLPDSVCGVLLTKMEDADLSLLPRLSPSRPALTQRALRCLTKGANLSELTDDNVLMLGPLLCELHPSQLRLLAPDVLNSSLQEMASCQHIPQRHRAQMIKLVKETFGDPSDWSPETMETMAAFPHLYDNAISNLPDKPWMKDILCTLMFSLKQPSNTLRKKCFSLTIASYAASSSSSKDDVELTVDLIEELGQNNVFWTAAQLARMSNETFLATLESIGAITDYSADQLVQLRKKAIETLGPVSGMTESVIIQLGCIIRGFSNAELKQLPLPLDTLENIANCGWNESQMEVVWKAVAKYNNLTAQQLGAAEMVALNQFICGLNSSEISQLDFDAFKEAVGSLNGVRCPFKIARQFKSLAESGFGHYKNWTVARVSALGSIISGMNSTELASLNPSVFPFINNSCIKYMNISALSVEQLKAFGSDNAAMVTSEQKGNLTDEQQTALEMAVTGSFDSRPRSDPTGAPSLSVEGVSAFMKPLLFLLMGFLLL